MIQVFPAVSVIIPTRNGAKRLSDCLQALTRALGPHDELIVVNDGSTDETETIAMRFSCKVLNIPKSIGAARARNYGAKQAKNEILFFTDDDIIVNSDIITRLRSHFLDPNISGVVGVLDSQIPFTDYASNLKNLWMRFSYLECPREKVGLFYTSVASIRREVFYQVGGFDENYIGASLLEDTEFGQRVWQQGYHIRIDPGLAVTHVKHYTWKSIIKTDFDRARALTHMKLRKWGQKFYTSVPLSFQLAVPIFLFFLVVIVSSWVFNFSIWWSTLPLCLYFALTANWIKFLFQSRGFFFGIMGTLFHPIDSFAIGLGMVSAILRHLRGKSY